VKSLASVPQFTGERGQFRITDAMIESMDRQWMQPGVFDRYIRLQAERHHVFLRILRDEASYETIVQWQSEPWPGDEYDLHSGFTPKGLH
jgi:hypothetical protein